MYDPLSGRPFSPNNLLNKAVSNVIASLTFARRFEYNDPRMLKLLDLVLEGLKEEVGLMRQVREGRRGGALQGELRGSSLRPAVGLLGGGSV